MYSCVLIAALLGGCDEGQDSMDTNRNGGVYCPRWQCGYNTSEINGKSLTELHLDGLPNTAGVRVIGFTAPLGLLGYKLDVHGDELIARGGLLGKSTLHGTQLIGSVIWLQVGGLPIPVTIIAYEEVESWATDADAVPAYGLIYPDLALPLLERSICKGTLLDRCRRPSSSWPASATTPFTRR